MNNMPEKKNIIIHETMFEGTCDKSLEAEIIIPEYMPSAVRILRTSCMPIITSRQVQGEKLVLDGSANFQIMYIPENERAPKTLVQDVFFTVEITMKKNDKPVMVKTKIKCETVIVKLLSPQKISVRANAKIAIKVWGETKPVILQIEEVDDLETLSQQVKAFNITVANEKDFRIMEELELPENKASAKDVISTQVNIFPGETKIIANKVIVKGDAGVKLLYVTDSSQIETATAMIPFTQIIDMESLDESSLCETVYTVTDIRSNVKDNDGAGNVIAFDAGINIIARGYQNTPVNIITDAYSLKNEYTIKNMPINFEELESIKFENFTVNDQIEMPENALYIADAQVFADIDKISISNNTMTYDGEVKMDIIYADEENEFRSFEKSFPFKHSKEESVNLKGGRCEAEIVCDSVSCSLMGGNRATVKLDMKLYSQIFESEKANVITEIDIDMQKAKIVSTKAPLVLYYAAKDEKLWDIAKNYNTSMNQILSINNLEETVINEDRMIIIPKYVKTLL